jgi:hypothetical protein
MSSLPPSNRFFKFPDEQRQELGAGHPFSSVTRQQLQANCSGGSNVETGGSQSITKAGKNVGEELGGHVWSEG